MSEKGCHYGAVIRSEFRLERIVHIDAEIDGDEWRAPGAFVNERREQISSWGRTGRNSRHILIGSIPQMPKTKRVMMILVLLSYCAFSEAAAQTIPTPQTVNNPVGVTQLYVLSSHPNVWITCVSFVNNTAHEIQAVQFRFIYVDAFGVDVASFLGDRVGDFSPGALIQGPSDPTLSLGSNGTPAANCWSDVQVIGSLSAVHVAISKIRYGDGTIWVNPQPTPIFTGQYLGSDADHPDTVLCHIGILRVRVTWERAIKSPGCKSAIDDWRRTHLQQMLTSPSPSPSPTAFLEKERGAGQTVHGIIIAIDDRLKIRGALRITQNTEFFQYQVDFELIKKSIALT